MLNIALTGNRFSGKDGVAKLFEKIKVSVFNADAILKYILNYRPDFVKVVKKNFGNNYIIGDYINPIAFDTDEKFNKLIDLVEFELFECYNRFKIKNSDKPYTIFHSSLVFERNYEKKFDNIISVFAKKDDRIYRCQLETGEKLEYIHSLLSKEMSENFKNKMSDYVIHNYKNAPDILNQIKKIDNKIVDDYLSINSRVDNISTTLHLKNINA